MHKHHDSLLDLQKKCHKKCLQSLHRRRLDSMEYDHRVQEMNSANGSPIARGGAGARSWCGHSAAQRNTEPCPVRMAASAWDA